jgi:hypothetical protein
VRVGVRVGVGVGVGVIEQRRYWSTAIGSTLPQNWHWSSRQSVHLGFGQGEGKAKRGGG